MPMPSFRLAEAVSPVCLPSKSDAAASDLTGATATVIGWGKISETGTTASDLHMLEDRTVISNEECLASFDNIKKTHICVSAADHAGVCNGDSGGPLLVQGGDGRYTQVGITSFGSGDSCSSDKPKAFTRVGEFLDWIGRKTGIVIEE